MSVALASAAVARIFRAFWAFQSAPSLLPSSSFLVLLFGGGSIVGNQPSEWKDPHVAVLADEPCVGKRCAIILSFAQKASDLVENALARVTQKFVRFGRKVFEEIGGRVGVTEFGSIEHVEFRVQATRVSGGCHSASPCR